MSTSNHHKLLALCCSLPTLLLAQGCPAPSEDPEGNNNSEPVVVITEGDMGGSMDDDMSMMEPTNNMSPNTTSNMEPMGCSVGERCGDECVDTQTDAVNCGMCGNTCSDGAACLEGGCQEQVADCRQEACKGFFYCDLSNGECLEGCDRDDQCNANSSCDVFSHECECDEGFHGCAGQCVDSTSPQHCGDRCEPCPSPANGSGTCNADGSCGIVCDAGYHQCGDRCVADDSVDHCGSRCEPCPTDPSGTAVCSAAGQCEIQCDDDFRMCGGACAACPTDATGTSCSGNSCIASACPTDTLLCDGQCSTCPSDPGATSLTCSAQDQCVVQSCQNGYELCGGGCKTCPTQNVVSASCNSSGECAIEACTGTLHPCGDSCCGWANTPTLITKTDAREDIKLVRDASGLSLSMVDHGQISSYSSGEHWLLNPSNNTWSKVHTYEFDHLVNYGSDDRIFAFREGNQNYALILDGDQYQLVTPSGQDNWSIKGSVSGGSDYDSVEVRGEDGEVYVTTEDQNFRGELQKVSVSASQKFSKISVNFPDDYDALFVNKAGDVYLYHDDFFDDALVVYEKSGSNFVSKTAFTCNSFLSYHGDFGFVVDPAGNSTLLRVQCSGSETDGLWATSELPNGQWDHTLVTTEFDGSANISNSDWLGNLSIAPDGTLHTCFIQQGFSQDVVFHSWRASDPTSPWTTRQVHSAEDVRECVVGTTSDSEPHIVWYEYDDADFSNSWAYYHLAPN